MSSKRVQDVAVVFDDLTEFFAIRNNIDTLIQEGVGVDIYVVSNYNPKMGLETKEKISEFGYLVRDIPAKDRKYKILLEPYHLVNKEELDFEFRIKYSYGASSTKPNPVFLPEWNLLFDASISYSKRDTEARRAYGRAYTVAYAKYKNFKKVEHAGKPNLLYLPTFGEVSSIGALNDETVLKLKKEYNFIIKAHHATQFSSSEQSHYSLIQGMADEFYNSDTPLEVLLTRADVVLSDNSGAIFEAIYSETPVAVFSNRLNEQKLGGINTFQYDLVKEGIIPCAKKPEDIMDALDEAVKLFSKQKGIKQRYFIANSEDTLDDFVSIIKKYLSKDREKDVYLMSHDILRDSFNEKRHKIEGLEFQLQQLQSKIVEYENSKSWKVTLPLRRVGQLVKNIKNKKA